MTKRRTFALAFAAVLFSPLAVTMSPTAFGDTEIVVGAAASLKEALEALKPVFEAEHKGVKVSLNLAASSAVARQIRAKAPVDVFFSADEDNMDNLAKDGRIDTATRKDVVGNELVLVTPAAFTTQISGLADLENPAVKAIALCDQSVPVGGYARKWIEKAGLTKKLEAKVVKPDNVRTALALVASGTAQAGFVYATDIAIERGKVKVATKPAAADGINVRYPAAVVMGTTHPNEAAAFVTFLSGAAAQAQFKTLGFSAP